MTVTFPGTKLTIIVKLLGIVTPGVYTDVSQYVYKSTKVKIKRGLTANDKSHDGSFDTCNLRFINTDQRFSPRNMNSPYAGRLGINTRMQVYWDAGNGNVFRFEGVIPFWPPSFSIGENRYVDVQATDDRRRMQIGPGLQISDSPIYASTNGQANLIAYMPLQDGANTQTPTVIGAGHVARSGNMTWANDSTLPGSTALPTFDATSYLIFGLDAHRFVNGWQYDWFEKLDAAPSTTTILKRIWVTSTGGSNIAYWDIELTSISLAVKAYDRNGAIIVNSGTFTIAALYPGTWMHLRFMAKSVNKLQFDWQFVMFKYDTTGGSFVSGSAVTGQAGDLAAVSIGMAQAGYDGFSNGHHAVYDDYNFSAVDGAGSAFNAEPPGTRWSRILDEQGIDNTRRVGAGSDTVAMGQQVSNDVMSNLRECLLANEGFMEGGSTTTDDGKLRFTERSYLEAKAAGAAAMTLDYAQRKLRDLKINDTDAFFVNDMTATRAGGASARVVQESGPRNVNSPDDDPLGVYRYPGSQAYSLSTDTQALDHAGWVVNLNTVDEPYVESLKLSFHRTGMSTLLTTWEGMDTWQRVLLTSPPSDIGAEPLDFLIAGYTEEFDQFELDVTMNGRPSSPYRVGILDSSGGATSDQRLDLGDTRTLSALGAADTTMYAYVANDERIPTLINFADGAFKVRVGGENMNISAASTVTPSFVGAGAAQTSNNATIASVPIHASTAKGDVMVLVGGSRNVNATVDTAAGAGWEPLVAVSAMTSLRMWVKPAAASGGGTAPNLTVSGGSAGDDVLAQVYTLRGVSPYQFPRFGDDSAAVQVNASAANIAFPLLISNRLGCAFLLAGLRADDWTGGAAPAFWTEIGDFSSTVGNDAGLWVGWLFTTGEGVDASSIVITGGVSAVSRSVVVALDANVQSLTVARGDNNGGVGVAHDAGLEVHVVNPIILGV